MLAFPSLGQRVIFFLDVSITEYLLASVPSGRNDSGLSATDTKQPRYRYNVNFRLNVLSRLIMAPLKLKPLLVFAVTALSPRRWS